jgi:hypothetical protein
MYEYTVYVSGKILLFTLKLLILLFTVSISVVLTKVLEVTLLLGKEVVDTVAGPVELIFGPSV